MTKKKTTKRNLTWKLENLPTASEVKELVETGILSKDEAREIILGNAESDKDKIEALETHVKFLEELVKDLAKNRSTTVYQPIYRTIDYTPKPYFEKVWMSTANNLKASGINLSSTVSDSSGGWVDGSVGKVTLSASIPTIS